MNRSAQPVREVHRHRPTGHVHVEHYLDRRWYQELPASIPDDIHIVAAGFEYFLQLAQVFAFVGADPHSNELVMEILSLIKGDCVSWQCSEVLAGKGSGLAATGDTFKPDECCVGPRLPGGSDAVRSLVDLKLTT